MNKTTLPTEYAIPNIDNNIFRIIRTFLPGYRTKGPHSLKLVNKTWQILLNEIPDDPSAKFPQTILEECKTPDDALFLLNDITLVERLSRNDLLLIATTHPQLAELLFRHPDQKVNFSIPELLNVGAKNAWVAKYILDNETLRARILSTDNLVLMASKHAELAQHMIKTPALYHNLNEKDLATLGFHHITVAQMIINTAALCDKLGGNDLAKLGGKHPTIAAQIIQREDLVERLSHCNLAELSISDLLVPERSSIMRDLYLGLTEGDLYDLGMRHNIVAHYIINTESLRSKLFFWTWCEIAAQHKELSLQIANDCISTEYFCAKDLVTLGSQHVETAQIIFANPYLRQKIAHSPAALTNIGSKHGQIGLLILKDPELSGKLSADNLTILASKHVALAEYIVKTPGLRCKFAHCNPYKVGFDFPVVTEFLIRDLKSTQKIEPEDLNKLRINVRLAKNIHALAKKFQPTR